ncbi:ferredoxin-thioredoxin reductase variable chain [Pseudanabaena sp. PCC 6802]|uniref:ferredoxin-thioredoxin reductase variable chain n=1 Tax=Pseudanabaena sp. PCC 6802 TaxID=118173 RepID=UPI00034661E0|nr:ferredoxin-thioredoxin reductase variable chain [Pseudanabaena sp. PCC 6802]
MKVGDRVRVVESVVVYHHPDRAKQAFDLKGSEGEIVEILSDWHGRPISPNYPILIEFQGSKKRFKTHLSDRELEVV